jgi:hypothetical protein
VGNDAGDVLGLPTGAFDDFFRGFLHAVDRDFEDLLALHVEGVEVLIDVSAVIGQAVPPPGISSKWVRLPSVPISVATIEPSPGSARRSTAAPAPSPKQHAGRAILPIGDGGEFFRTDDQAFLKAPSEMRRLQIFIA